MLSTHLSLWFTILLRRLRNIPPPVSIYRSPVWDRDKPLVSVVIPCYNHGHYLADAVDSVLSQTWQGFEIIVVNDGSTDSETNQILADFRRPKTRIIHLPKNRGLPAARNAGIEEARGKYICCLDADDKLQETYIEKIILVMEVNAGISFVWPWTQVFGDEDRVWYNPQFNIDQLLYFNQPSPASVFMKAAWQQSGGFNQDMREGFEDWEFWVRMAGHGFRGYRVSEKLLNYRRVGYSFAMCAAEKKEKLFEQIRNNNYHLYADESKSLTTIKNSYRDLYNPNFFKNLDSGNWLLIKSAALIISNLDSQATLNWLQTNTQPKTMIWVARQALDEAVIDALYQGTPYVYVLPNFLPRYTYSEFIQQLQRRLSPHLIVVN